MTGQLVAPIGWALLHFLWQGALVGAAVALQLRTMRGADPELRYLVACAGLLACLCWPALELAASLSAASPDAVWLAGPAEAGGAGTVPARLFAALGAHLAELVALWAACALALSVRLAAGLVWIHRCARDAGIVDFWERRARALAGTMGIRRAVRVRAMDGLATPVTAGWLRPLIVLPASLVSGMPQELLHALVAHELAHIRRWDYPVNLMQNLIETALFYHPAVWWISRRVRIERELIADGIAARTLGEPRVLADALAALDRHQAAGAPVLAANGGALLERIRALVRPAPRRAGRANFSAALLALVLTLPSLAGLGSAAARTAATGTGTATARQALIDFSTCVKPQYPAASLAAGRQGTVTLDFEVGSAGDVVGVAVHASSGDGLLDAAAVESLSRCRFKPALAGGRPVASHQAVRYVWALK
jgi:bla regulator protein BlaR1